VGQTIANARRAKDTVVATMQIWAFNKHAVKKAAAIIDACKPDLPDNPKTKEPNGQISYAEIAWAKKQIEKMKRGEDSAIAAKVPEEERESFYAAFDELVTFFDAPMKNLDMVRRAPLLLGEKQYDDVFEIDNKAHLERDLSTMLQAGYDLIAVKDTKRKKTYVALNHHGSLKRVAHGTEGLLKTPYFEPVKVVFAEDLNNGFWEGISLIPRSILQLVSDVFSRGKNRVLQYNDGSEKLEEPIKEIATYVSPASVVLSNQQGSNVPGVVLAVAIGLGAVNLTTLMAQAPEAAVVIGGIATVGTIYNAIFGRFFRRQDPYFILNFAGIQLARKSQVSDVG
jgi:hypothetical protein